MDKTTECPECGCPEYLNKNLVGEGFRQCAKCGQDWWIDIDYKPSTITVKRSEFDNLQTENKNLRVCLNKAKTAITNQASKWFDALKQNDDNAEYYRGLADGYGGAWNLLNGEHAKIYHQSND